MLPIFEVVQAAASRRTVKTGEGEHRRCFMNRLGRSAREKTEVHCRARSSLRPSGTITSELHRGVDEGGKTGEIRRRMGVSMRDVRSYCTSEDGDGSLGSPLELPAAAIRRRRMITPVVSIALGRWMASREKKTRRRGMSRNARRATATRASPAKAPSLLSLFFDNDDGIVVGDLHGSSQADPVSGVLFFSQWCAAAVASGVSLLGGNDHLQLQLSEWSDGGERRLGAAAAASLPLSLSFVDGVTVPRQQATATPVSRKQSDGGARQRHAWRNARRATATGASPAKAPSLLSLFFDNDDGIVVGDLHGSSQADPVSGVLFFSQWCAAAVASGVSLLGGNDHLQLQLSEWSDGGERRLGAAATASLPLSLSFVDGVTVPRQQATATPVSRKQSDGGARQRHAWRWIPPR
nr:hypothetical protein Iba_chr13cCG14250 [Ipomoea batatas]